MIDSANDNTFYCMACNRPFHTPLFSITRSTEQMIFYPGERLPEANVLSAESIGDYCSETCLNKNRYRLMESDGVRPTYPGPGPIESCSRCSAPVDMSSPHWTWTEEVADVSWGDGIDYIQPTKAILLAVRCQKCSSGTETAAKCDSIDQQIILT